MSVAHDLNALEEQKRKEAARRLVSDAAQRLHELRRKTHSLQFGDAEAWAEADALAQDVIRGATPLDLGLLVACAREVLHFTARRAAGRAPDHDLVLYLLTSLDTLGMELERLRCDKDLR